MMAGLVVFDLGFDPELLVREWAGRVLGQKCGLGLVCVWICSNNKGPDWFWYYKSPRTNLYFLIS